jgi:GNAT superfamily N-acetyltransferase
MPLPASTDDVLSLEADSNRAWPAREVIEGPHWEIRLSDGLHRRTNSATILPGPTVDDAVDVVEGFYTDRGAVPIVKLTREASPAGLDAVLADRGWVREATTQVRTAPIGEVAADPSIELATPRDAWFDAFTSASEYDDGQAAALSAILDRIDDPAAFASASVGETIAAVGLGVLTGDRIGIFEMVTVPAHRGKGLAGAIVRSLVAWGGGNGAGEAFLQVLADNRAAIHLYSRTGFSERYRYWYRVRRPAANG